MENLNLFYNFSYTGWKYFLISSSIYVIYSITKETYKQYKETKERNRLIKQGIEYIFGDYKTDYEPESLYYIITYLLKGQGLETNYVETRYNKNIELNIRICMKIVPQKQKEYLTDMIIRTLDVKENHEDSVKIVFC